MDINQLGQIITDNVIDAIPSILFALVTLVVGWFLIKYIVRVIRIILEKRKVEVTITKFFTSLASVGLKVFLLIGVISIIGVETTSLIAFIGAIGFALGLALQGGLANFAGGLLILFFKPFKVGDFILAQGNLGTVEAIQIFNTTLKTPDGIFMYIPNGSLANSAVTNFSKHKTRRIDLTIGISYDDDIDKAKKVLTKILTSEKRVLSDPAFAIVVNELADSSVNFSVRAWVKGSDWWPTQTTLLETIKKTFDKNNITIPFPQREVHMRK